MSGIINACLATIQGEQLIAFGSKIKEISRISPFGSLLLSVISLA